MTQILIGAVAFAAVVLIFKGVRVVPQAENHILERFGKFSGVLKPGLNLINPIFTSVAFKIDIREEVLDLPQQSIITKDNATVIVDAVVFYKVMDPYNACYGIHDLRRAMTNLAMTTLRSLMGRLSLDESFSSREKINHELLIILDEATEAWGTKITEGRIKRCNAAGTVSPGHGVAEKSGTGETRDYFKRRGKKGSRHDRG